MRIIHINTSDRTGGAAQVAGSLQREQVRRDHQSSLVSSETLGILRHLNALAYRFSSCEGVFASWGGFFRSDAFINADIVHLHNAHGYYMPQWALTEVLKKPCLWTLHDYWLLTGRCAMPEACTGFATGCDPCPYKSKYPATWFDRAASDFRFRRKLLGSKILFVSPSEFTRSQFSSGCHSIRTICNPVQMPDQMPSRAEAKRRLGLPEDKTVVLFPARKLEAPRKGLQTFLNALDVIRNVDHLYPVFVGEQGSLQLFGPGLVDRPAMTDYLCASDIVVVPSTMETFGLIYAEAVIAGASVIAADIPIAREILGRTGRFHPPNDHEALAGLLMDRPQYAGVESRSAALEKFSVRRACDLYLEAYSQAIELQMH